MICAFLQVRMSSKRFPNKVIKKINNEYLFLHVYNRVSLCKKINEVIILTSNNKTDNIIAKICIQKKIKFFRGSLNNVYIRYCEAIKKFKPKTFVRVNGDSPLIDYKIIDRAIELYKKKKVDIVTNVFPKSFPKGQSVEVINSKTFTKVKNKIKSKFEREHVTPFFYENHKLFKIFNIKNNKNLSNFQLSVDTKYDFQLIKKLHKHLKSKKIFNLKLIIKIYSSLKK